MLSADYDACLLVGPTGSGKTPLGQVLEMHGLWGRPCRHFDFGQQLRSASAGEGAAGCLDRAEKAVIAQVLRQGALLDDEHFGIAAKLLGEFLREDRRRPPAWIVLNGLPRHVGQARDVEAIVRITMVVELQCEADVILHRVGANSGGDRAGRQDDTPDAVRHRLTLYGQRTGPLVDYYRARGCRVELCAVGPSTTGEDLWRELELRRSEPKEP